MSSGRRLYTAAEAAHQIQEADTSELDDVDSDIVIEVCLCKFGNELRCDTGSDRVSWGPGMKTITMFSGSGKSRKWLRPEPQALPY